MEESMKIDVNLITLLGEKKLARRILTSERGLPILELEVLFMEPKEETKINHWDKLLPYILKTDNFPKKWYETTKKLFFPYSEESGLILGFNKKESNLIYEFEEQDFLYKEIIKITPEEIINKELKNSLEPHILKRSHGKDGRIIIDLESKIIAYDSLV
jgi:hypothetical protein